MPEKENNGIENTVPTVDNNTVNSSIEQNPGTNESLNVSPVQDVVQPTQPNVNEFGVQMSSELTNNSKPKKKLIPIIAIIAIVLVVGGGIAYFALNSKPTKILTNAINDAYKDFSKSLKDMEKNAIDFDVLKDSLMVSGELSVGGDLFKGLENDKIKFNIGMDAGKERLEGSASISENGKDLLDATIFAKDGKAYLKSDSLLKNTYYLDDFKFDDVIDLDDIKDAMNQVDMPSIDDIDFIVKSIKDAVIASLDEDSMTKSKEEIKINKVNVKATKISYTVDAKSTEKFVKSMIKEMKKNKKLLDKVANIAQADADELKELLDQAEDSVDFDGMPKGKLNIYTAGLTNKVAKIEFVMEGITISYSDYKDNIYLLVSDKEDDIKFEIVGETKKDVTTLDVKLNGEKYASFKIRSMTSECVDFDFDIDVPKEIAGTKITASGTIKVVAKKDNDKSMSGSVEVSVDADVDGNKANVSGKLSYKLKIGEDIASYSVSGAKDIDSVTEEDQEKLMKAITDLQDTQLFKFIESYTGSLGDIGDLFGSSSNDDLFSDLDNNDDDDDTFHWSVDSDIDGLIPID